jgi:hypothetical protein
VNSYLGCKCAYRWHGKCVPVELLHKMGIGVPPYPQLSTHNRDMDPEPTSSTEDVSTLQSLQLCLQLTLSQPEDFIVDTNGHVKCPDCHQFLNVGSVGIQNLKKRHRGSAKCKENKLKYQTQQSLQKSQAMVRQYFAPRPPNVPPTVTAPPRIQATPIANAGKFRHHSTPPEPPNNLPSVTGCPEANRLLSEFHTKINKLPPERSGRPTTVIPWRNSQGILWDV